MMTRSTSIRSLRGAVLTAAIACCGGAADAQVPVAEDDGYGVPYAATLVVELPGVLANDTGTAGATAELLTGVGHGVLDCAADPASYDLCPDGSFSYTPDSTFAGFDSFTYQVVSGAGTSQATVTLAACTGGPAVFVCWHESAYRAKLGQLGYGAFSEGFEDDAAWGDARWPLTQPSVLSQAVTWQTNHASTNPITTGVGPALTGIYGVYDPDHGYATGTPAECDVNDPPVHCLFKDGFTGTRPAGSNTLFGVGGYFKGFAQPNLTAILDGGAPIGLGRLLVAGHQFFGVIDIGGFDAFRIEETDGKVGQERFVFADDFVLASLPADTTPPRVVRVGSFEDTGDGELAEGETTSAAITELTVELSESVQETGGLAPGDVTNPANYLLVSDGGDGFETASCSGGVAGTDVQVAVDWVGWGWHGPLTSTVAVNGGQPLGDGSYRLLVCGSTSIVDWAGNALDGNGDGVGGDDFVRSFTVTVSTPPSARPDSYAVNRGSLLSVAAPGILANDTGSAALTAQLVAGPSRAASFQLHADGSFSYTHDGLSTVADSFTYRAFDGTATSASATVTLNVGPVPFTWYVDPAGSDLADCLSPAAACASLAEAVLRAIDGDRVEMAAGTYLERPILNEDLTVVGAPGSVLDGAGVGVVVTVTASATATLSGLEIRGGAVGGVENFGDLSMVGCWVRENGDGLAGSFGGVANQGTALVLASTVSGNLGDVSAGISNSGQLGVVNSTVHGNVASFTSGIDNTAGSDLVLRYSTVAGNGPYGIRNDGTLTMEATVVSGHATANCASIVTSVGRNLESGDSCGLDPLLGDQPGVEPLLQPLSDNGGPTPTLALEATSPAVDRGGGSGCPATDQRGVPRPVDGDGDTLAVCDVGAYELIPGPMFADGFESGDLTAWDSATGGM